MDFSARASVVYRRTYSRPLEGGVFETWEQTVDRVIAHQEWLWQRAKGYKLNERERTELDELKALLLARKAMVAGRSLWLGGTDVSRRRESSQFNCSHLCIASPSDFVDAYWLLLQGCGVGFTPRPGTLNGFARPIPNIEVVRSARTAKGGSERNVEVWDSDTKCWTIRIGDSGEAWAKAVGKLLAGKYPAQRLVLDFSELRPAGDRLGAYGWISQGDELFAKCFQEIAHILNKRAGQMLSAMNILDIMNWLGTSLSTRRSAEIALYPSDGVEANDFATAKKDYWTTGNPQRAQSNNSIVYYSRPSRSTIREQLQLMVDCGGSEPGIINATEALRRAPYMKGVNPCAEILLCDKGFCNLVTVDVAKFKEDWAGLLRAVQLIARANYRQTQVNLHDEVLQDAWHENNEFLRLCGVSLTGIAMRPDLTPYHLKCIRNAAITGSMGMADQLDTQYPKNVTCIKPEGTLSKLMDTTEGIHDPLGEHIFNNINFSSNDPLVAALERAGYEVREHPIDSSAVLVKFPVHFPGVGTRQRSAIEQLERYKLYMDNYVDQNASITVSYNENELEDVATWLDHNWQSYVGVAFIKRVTDTDASKAGHAYLPQEVVTSEVFAKYTEKLRDVDFSETESGLIDEECGTGSCPIR